MKFNWNFDFLTKWTVSGVSFVYHMFIQHIYFVLSNILFLMMLFIFQLTMNNFILFVVPIFLLLVSFGAQFKMGEVSKVTVSLREYCLLYRRVLCSYWQTFLFYTLLIAFVVFDVKVLLLLNGGLMIIPLFITAGFLTSGMFFVFLLSTDERAKKLSLGQKFFSMLLVSYRLPQVTLVNIFLFMVLIFLIQQYAMLYLLFFGGAINYMILANLKRRFSVKLYFEQTEKEN